MEKQIKKLTLNKETLRDLMAHNTGEVKGGNPETMNYGITCPGYTITCTCKKCHITKGKPCH